MRQLSDIAAGMHVSVEYGDLAGAGHPVAGRYIESERRIIIQSGLSFADTWRALALALGHVRCGSIPGCMESTARVLRYVHRLLAVEALLSAGCPSASDAAEYLAAA